MARKKREEKPMPDSIRDLMVRGVAAAKTGDAKEARFYLEWLLRLDPQPHEKIDALYWLCEISTDRQEQREYIETILAFEPTEMRARRKLAILDGQLDPNDIVDPDRLIQSAPSEPQAASARRFTCPKCGGRMSYAPNGRSLVCEYCEIQERLTKQKGQSTEVREDDFLVAMATVRGHQHPLTEHTITCQGCGAQFILPPEELSRSCPYCSTPYALDQVETRQFDRPNGIIPFSVDEKQARQFLRDWLQRQRFESLPKVAAGRGLYLPVWTFDIGGMVRWTCEVKSGDKWQPRSGERLVGHNDLPIFATRRLPEALLLAVTGYRLNEMVPYDPRYLASWMAETYQVAASDSSLPARQYALLQAQKKVESSFFEQVRDLRLDSTPITIDAYRLILVPAWRTYLVHDRQRFEILINGQTGEVTAERPTGGFGGIMRRIFNS